MWTLLGLAVVEGFVTAISPCVLPVLPVIFAAGSTGGTRRSISIVAGLGVFFGAATLLGQVVLSAIGLPLDALFDAGIALLILLGLALAIDPIGRLLERPFSRLATAPRVGGSTRSGFVLGAGLGLVFTPCAGPVLIAVTAAAGSHRLSWDAAALTGAYVVGVAVPLLIIALMGERLARTWSLVRRHARAVRRGAGVVIGSMGIVIATGALTVLQTSLPGYATSIEQQFSSTSTSCRLLTVAHESASECLHEASLGDGAALPDLRAAPSFTAITSWLNTPGGRPLTLRSLRGHVVLVDFWTYSCINCRRSIPHVEAWYRKYHRFGLDIVGVHTPEFPFEYVASNVRDGVSSLGITYPVAVDDHYGTWNAYNNNSWPAEYLVDQNGEVRHTSIGEGDYAGMEADIRLLLQASGATDLPAPTDVANRTPTEQTTAESYLGWERIDNNLESIYQDAPHDYALPTQVPPDTLGFGGTWTDERYDALAGSDAVLELRFQARDVYLVLGGTGTVTVRLDGRVTGVVHVHGYPDLYTLVAGPFRTGLLTLDASSGVRAYDFTFG